MIWTCRQHTLALDRVLVMGIVNVTPDSFSDGGRFFDVEAAIAHGVRLAEDGADILDVGGESTRPGAEAVAPEAERDRVVPVIEGLRARLATPISIDTSKAGVARAALAAGAEIVNDVSALGDPAMPRLIAETRAGCVLMHMRGSPRTMQQAPAYADVVRDVRDYLAGRLRVAVAAGIPADAVALDPGIGFGKTLEHNCELHRRLPELTALGRPILMGASRKSFLGRLTGATVDNRMVETAAAVAAAVFGGARIVRVHDVREMLCVVRVAEALAPRREPAS